MGCVNRFRVTVRGLNCYFRFMVSTLSAACVEHSTRFKHALEPPFQERGLQP